jgi:anti-anti-sigma factor
MDLRSELNLSARDVDAAVPLTVIEASGRINLSNSAELEALAQACHARGRRYLLLDLAGVPSISSAGLRSIHLIYKLLESSDAPATVSTGLPAARSSRLKIFAPAPQIRNVLHTAGFDQYIEVFADRQAALDAFNTLA